MMRLKARKHEGTKARSSGCGFSLVEVLLAIVILGIGVISIAALFPAGIAQQRLANDDLMGPVVANQAISIIRAKVSQEDFGTFEDFADYIPSSVAPAPSGYFTRTIAGDWGWMRPAFLLTDDGGTTFNEAGAIDIFSHRRVAQVLGWTGANNVDVASELFDGWPDVSLPPPRRPLRGIPFNREKHSAWESFPGGQMPIPPRAIIAQRERFYPMSSHLGLSPEDPPQPQYVWDCMFRRHQGRVQVAVFVYRVSAPGAAAAQPYVVQPNLSDSTVPPLPIAIDLTAPGTDWPDSPDVWDILYREDGEAVTDDDRPLPQVYGFAPDAFNPLREDQSWQSPRQWILDQNNNVHRVVSVRRPTANDDENRMVIELTRPLTPVRLPYFGGASEVERYNNANDTMDMPFGGEYQDVNLPSDSPDEYFGNPEDQPISPNMVFPYFDRGVVTRFWYIPLRVAIDDAGSEFVLTPVYIAVKEL